MKKHPILTSLLIAGVLTAYLHPSSAADWQLGTDTKLSLNMTVTAGSSYRIEAPDPAVLGSVSSARLGLGPGQLLGNAGSNDLNFQRGEAVSSVIKSLVELDLKHQQSGLFVRAKIFHDFALKNQNRAYGNSANGFQTNVPLSDRGFDPNARFSNAQFADVYGFTRFDFDKGKHLDIRLGRQSLDWGVARTISGGIGSINPFDFPAIFRPAALPQEGLVPVGMLHAAFDSGQGYALEGFVRYETRQNILLPCGTFYAPVNFGVRGCSYISVLGGIGVDDPTAIANGLFPRRLSDNIPSGSGQYGFSARYAAPKLDTRFRVYAARFNNNLPSIQIINPNIAGGFGNVMSRLTDPNGLQYRVAYVPEVRLLGISAESLTPGDVRWFGEFSYRPNQALSFNGADLIGAFLGRDPNSALNRSLKTNALPPGATFNGFQRFAVSQISLGTSYAFNKIAAAEKVTLFAEAGLIHVDGLPDPNVLRFGRSDDYGGASSNGLPCVDTTLAQKACALDGFITTNAWGYRLGIDARYLTSWMQVTPSLFWSRDRRGYSYDTGFSQGRRTMQAGLRFDFPGKYFALAQYNRIAGGAYNNQIDRDAFTLAVGAKF